MEQAEWVKHACSYLLASSHRTLFDLQQPILFLSFRLLALLARARVTAAGQTDNRDSETTERVVALLCRYVVWVQRN